MSGHVRKATIEDCPGIMELVNELAMYENAPQEVTVDFNHFVESGFGPNPVWWAYVVEMDGAVQGFALCYTRYSTWKGRQVFLEDLLLTEKYRGKGLGKLLVDKVIEDGKSKGFNGIVWQVLDWNEPAINFYKKYEGVIFDEEWINCRINF